MHELKSRITRTVGALLSVPGEALALKVAFNGVLLHGPRGGGKTFITRATAGEFACNFLSVSCGELVNTNPGDHVRRIFDFARANTPMIVLFEHFDAIATRRGVTAGSGHTRRALE